MYCEIKRCMLVSLKSAADFSRGCAGKRIGYALFVTGSTTRFANQPARASDHHDGVLQGSVCERKHWRGVRPKGHSWPDNQTRQLRASTTDVKRCWLLCSSTGPISPIV